MINDPIINMKKEDLEPWAYVDGLAIVDLSNHKLKYWQSINEKWCSKNYMIINKKKEYYLVFLNQICGKNGANC